MKEVLVTIKATIDQDVLDDRRDCGDTDEEIIAEIRGDFNNAKISFGLVSDFEVEDIQEARP